MIRIAVVEDERESLDTVLNCLKRFEEEEGIGFVTTVFCDGLDFISGYRPLYDIVFMDIEMPMLNGMSTAKKLRKVDSSVALVFITRLRQYALLGYEVASIRVARLRGGCGGVSPEASGICVVSATD